LKKGDPRLLGCADVIHRQTCAKAEFDLVLVDAPPLSDSSIGLSIAKHVDGVVLVVEAEKTRWPELVSAKNDLAGAGGNLIGVVFNKRRNHIPAWLARFL
jgi:Mrp family chromosome partitioning ATPase